MTTDQAPVSVWQGELQMSGVTLHVHVLSIPLDEAEAAAFARWQRGES